MSLDDLLVNLASAEIPDEDVPRVVTAVSAILAAVAARQMGHLPPSSHQRPSPDDDRLLTAEEVASLLGVPKSYVYELARRGGPDALPSVTFGRYVRFRLADLQSWQARHQRQPVDTPPSHPPAPSHDRQRGTARPAARTAPVGRHQVRRPPSGYHEPKTAGRSEHAGVDGRANEDSGSDSAGRAERPRHEG